MAKTTRLYKITEHPKYAALVAEQEEYAKRISGDKAALDAAARDMAQAQQTLDTTESRLLAGRADEAEFAAAQRALADAKRAHALAHHTHEDTRRMLDLLPSAITQAKADAQRQVAETLREEYGRRVAALRQALLDAAEASQRVHDTYLAAAQEFPQPFELHPVYHAGVIDLQDAGVTTGAARLVDMSFQPVMRFGALDTWMEQADALLAQLPSMAQQDLDARQALDTAMIVQHERDEEIKRQQLERARRDAQALQAFRAK